MPVDIDIKKIFDFKDPKRRNLLIFAGVGGAALGLFVLSRRQGGAYEFSSVPGQPASQDGGGEDAALPADAPVSADSGVIDQLNNLFVGLQDTLAAGFETGYANQQAIADQFGAVGSLPVDYGGGGGEVYYSQPSGGYADYASPDYAAAAAYQPLAQDLGYEDYAGTFENPVNQPQTTKSLQETLYEGAFSGAGVDAKPAGQPLQQSSAFSDLIKRVNQPIKQFAALAGGKSLATPTQAGAITGYEAAGVLGTKASAVIAAQPKPSVSFNFVGAAKQPTYTPQSVARLLTTPPKPQATPRSYNALGALNKVDSTPTKTFAAQPKKIQAPSNRRDAK